MKAPGLSQAVSLGETSKSARLYWIHSARIFESVYETGRVKGEMRETLPDCADNGLGVPECVVSEVRRRA